MNQKEIIYTGAISELNIILKSYGSKNIFLVRGKNSYDVCGAKAEIEKIAKNYTITEYFDFSNNPKFEEAEFGYEKFKKSNSDLLIAIGGGSVIDMAKLIKHFQISADNTESLPFIAIPTTAGTGSEATCFAVVYKNGIKDSIENEKLLPDCAIIDSNLLFGQTEYQMAVSGIDAFSQGIESYWNINATEVSMKYAEQAIKLMWENLEAAINGDLVAKEMISIGSHLAGKAINITKTTAPHALSYGFTSKCGLPHGHAVALFLPYFLEYNDSENKFNCNAIGGVEYISKTIRNIESFLNIGKGNLSISVYKWFKKVSISIDFADLSINENVFLEIIKTVNNDRMKNNPYRINTSDTYSIFYFNTNLKNR